MRPIGWVLVLSAMLMFGSAGAQALAPGGGIYVADFGNNLIVRIDDMTGAGWTSLDKPGAGILGFSTPTGIFVDAAGKIYVSDFANHRIVRMNDITGVGWTTLGSLGSGINQFAVPNRCPPLVESGLLLRFSPPRPAFSQELGGRIKLLKDVRFGEEESVVGVRTIHPARLLELAVGPQLC